MTGKERVIKALEFENPDRPPRDLWWLPAIEMTQKEELEELLKKFSMDIGTPKFMPGVGKEVKGLPFVPRSRSSGCSADACAKTG